VYAAVGAGLRDLATRRRPGGARRDNFESPRDGSSGAPALGSSREGMPFVSVTMEIQRLDWIDKYKKSIDEIASLGADTGSSWWTRARKNGASARINLDLRMTPTVEQLTIYPPREIEKAPCHPDAHRAARQTAGGRVARKITPSTDNGGWTEWFNSYRELLTHFAYNSRIGEWR
jgi:hypothetical protein